MCRLPILTRIILILAHFGKSGIYFSSVIMEITGYTKEACVNFILCDVGLSNNPDLSNCIAYIISTLLSGLVN